MRLETALYAVHGHTTQWVTAAAMATVHTYISVGTISIIWVVGQGRQILYFFTDSLRPPLSSVRRAVVRSLRRRNPAFYNNDFPVTAFIYPSAAVGELATIAVAGDMQFAVEGQRRGRVG